VLGNNGNLHELRQDLLLLSQPEDGHDRGWRATSRQAWSCGKRPRCKRGS